jgi:DNA-binding winged helix-turn-helix (wHTH) protein
MEDDAYRFGEFSLSPSERRLLRGEKIIPLPAKAFDAMHLLVCKHGSLVLRDEITRALWPNIYVTEANLTNIIVLLRKILGREAIQTVSKYGYRFSVPVLGEPGVKKSAYASFVRGKELAAERSLESIQRARDLFWLCLADDPLFPPAWAWLGRSCRMLEKFKAGASINLELADAAFRRALAIDPDLACAHHFYTQLQADMGHALDAMMRLAGRLTQHGEEPETLAGMVQVLRFCGLLKESVAAHERVGALDPTVVTSVAHTHFLQGEYARVFDTYGGKRYYLDAAAWASLGDTQRAMALLRERLLQSELSPLMSGLMASLLAILEGKGEAGMAIMRRTEVLHEPEILFYFARHCAMLNVAVSTIQVLRRARLGGFTSSQALEHDAVFARMRDHPDFAQELRVARQLEMHAHQALNQITGCDFVSAMKVNVDASRSRPGFALDASRSPIV